MKTVLVSQDSVLIDTVRKVTESVNHCQLRVFPQLDEALRRNRGSDMVLVIIHIPDGDHGDILKQLKLETAATESSRSILVIADTYEPHPTLQLLRMGVTECLCRPLDLRRLALLVDSLLTRAMHEHAEFPDAILDPKQFPCPEGYDPFFCNSREMNSTMQGICKVATTDTIILLTGETGTGKTRVARLIHDLSHRRREPFLVVNCAALSESLIESELFGHVKGAFTGAEVQREGKFAAAKSGTVLLDEIDALTMSAQCKLLRCADEHVFEPVGSNELRKLRARLVVASNSNLVEEVAAGRFRADLFYRLSVAEFRLPPLRDRRSEIRLLFESFLQEAAAQQNCEIQEAAPEVLDVLQRYHWPGNIRELRNAVLRAVALASGGPIQIDDLPDSLRLFARQQNQRTIGDSWAQQKSSENTEHSVSAQTAGPNTTFTVFYSAKFATELSPLAKARCNGELEHIKQTLINTGNNRSQAARELGISRVTLYKKLRKYGIMGPQAAADS